MSTNPTFLAPVVGRLTRPTETGHFLASYVLAYGDEYCGYSKVFKSRPPHLWTHDAIRKICGPAASSPDDALANAEKFACTVMRTSHPPYDINFGLSLPR